MLYDENQNASAPVRVSRTGIFPKDYGATRLMQEGIFFNATNMNATTPLNTIHLVNLFKLFPDT